MILATTSALKGIREGALREGLTGIADGGELVTEVEALRDTRVFAKPNGLACIMDMKAGQKGFFYCAIYTGRE